MNFLCNDLRDERGVLDDRKAFVDGYLGLKEKPPESKETWISHLCDFIEDSEHTRLSTIIFHLLEHEGFRC